MIVVSGDSGLQYHVLMKSGKLLISFWNICLDNLPEGRFARRRVAPSKAEAAINQARRNKSLLCVSQDDLLAPYCKRQQDTHEDLCRVLANKYGIKLKIADFTGSFEDDEGSLNMINPLSLVKVQGRDRLLIVTCMFAWPKGKRKDVLAMKVEPSTIEFHLIGAG
jgi:hypothetical protein